MNIGVISSRYAQSLLVYAKEQHAEHEIYENMFQLLSTMSQLKEFVVVLQNPMLTRQDKVRLVCEAVQNPSPVFERFVGLVVRQEREEFLNYIAHSYISLYRKDRDIVAVKVTTAVPLPENLKERISLLVKKQGHASVELENIVDSSIIGGFVMEANSVRLDASVSGALSKVEKGIVDNGRRLV